MIPQTSDERRIPEYQDADERRRTRTKWSFVRVRL